MIATLAALGVFAGALTTLAGQGGGLFLLLLCSVLIGPHAALAVSAPALLLGNLHRAVLFRRAIHRPTAGRMILGAVPGAFVGGLVAGVAPPLLLQALLVLVTTMAIARAAGWTRFSVPRAALGPAGFLLGAMTGTAGGAGVLLAPVLLASGLAGDAFIGTSAAIAVSLHVGRVVAYALAGLFTWDLARWTAVVTLAIFAGNALGERVRKKASPKATTRLEYVVLVVCVALSLLGLG